MIDPTCIFSGVWSKGCGHWFVFKYDQNWVWESKGIWHQWRG